MRDSQPPVEERGVNAAEVDGVDGFAVLRTRRVGMGAVQAAVDGPTEQEDRARGAVVGPAAAVLAQPPAELGEDQDHDPLRLAGLLQVVEERLERRPQLAEQVRVPREPSAMRIEAVEVHVVHPGALHFGARHRDNTSSRPPAMRQRQREGLAPSFTPGTSPFG